MALACFPQRKLNVIFKYYTSLFQKSQYLAEIRTFPKSYWSLFLSQSRESIYLESVFFSFKFTIFPRTYRSSPWWSGKWDIICLIYLKYISDCPIIFFKKDFVSQNIRKIKATFQMNYLTSWSEALEDKNHNANNPFLKSSSLVHAFYHLWVFSQTWHIYYVCFIHTYTHPYRCIPCTVYPKWVYFNVWISQHLIYLHLSFFFFTS